MKQLNNQTIKNTFGFTLIESMIYAAIVVFVGVVAIGLILNILEIRAKGKIMYSAQENARLSLNRIIQEIHAAEDINALDSDFGVNLADPANAGKKISLRTRDPVFNPTEIDVLSYAIRIKQGVGAWTELTAGDINITNLTFNDLSHPSGRGKNIKIELTAEFPNPEGAPHFDYNYSLESAAELRDRSIYE